VRRRGRGMSGGVVSAAVTRTQRQLPPGVCTGQALLRVPLPPFNPSHASAAGSSVDCVESAHWLQPQPEDVWERSVRRAGRMHWPRLVARHACTHACMAQARVRARAVLPVWS